MTTRNGLWRSARRAAVLAVLASGWLGLAAEGSDRPEFTAEAGVFSQYVWRGLVITDGPVVQPAVTVSYQGFHAGVWGNMDLNDVNGRRRQFSEVDYYAGYERSAGKLGLSGGVFVYTFPNTGYRATTELYAGASLATFLNPSVTAFFDVDEIGGTYISFDVSRAVALPKPGARIDWSAELAAGAGWGSGDYNSGYFGAAGSGFVDFHPSVSLPVTIAGKLTVTPALAYGNLVDRELRRSAGPHTHNFFGGVKVSFTY